MKKSFNVRDTCPALGPDGKYHHGEKWMPMMYVAYWGILQQLANEHGYALCVHGSVARDFDVIAVPFDLEVKSQQELLSAIRKAIGVSVKASHEIFEKVGHEPHGRTCYTIECGGGGYLDISFTPTIQQAVDAVKADMVRMEEIRRMVEQINTQSPFPEL